MKHFKWMVFDYIDREGIWFYTTQTHEKYVIYWNPIKYIKSLCNPKWAFGFFPLSKKHIKW